MVACSWQYWVSERQKIAMRRFGQIIGLKSDQIEQYERLHAAVWPEVLAMISVCNIRNYSIFLTLCLLSVTPSLKERSSYPNSTAIRHTVRGAPLWFHCPIHQGVLTRRPFFSSLAGQEAFAAQCCAHPPNRRVRCMAGRSALGGDTARSGK